MGAEYTANEAGLRAMAVAPFMVDAIRKIAERGQVAAIRNTPIDTGLMAASWRVWSGIKDGHAAGQVYNTAKNPQTGFHYPWALEAGTRYIRKRRILGRAIDDMSARP